MHIINISETMRASLLLLAVTLFTVTTALHLQALPPRGGNSSYPNPNTYPQPNPTPNPSPKYPGSQIKSNMVTANGVTFNFTGPFKYECYYKSRPNEIFRWDSCYDINGCSLMIKEYMKC